MQQLDFKISVGNQRKSQECYLKWCIPELKPVVLSFKTAIIVNLDTRVKY